MRRFYKESEHNMSDPIIFNEIQTREFAENNIVKLDPDKRSLCIDGRTFKGLSIENQTGISAPGADVGLGESIDVYLTRNKIRFDPRAVMEARINSIGKDSFGCHEGCAHIANTCGQFTREYSANGNLKKDIPVGDHREKACVVIVGNNPRFSIRHQDKYGQQIFVFDLTASIPRLRKMTHATFQEIKISLNIDMVLPEIQQILWEQFIETGKFVANHLEHLKKNGGLPLYQITLDNRGQVNIIKHLDTLR